MRLDTLYKSTSSRQINLTIGRGHLNGLFLNFVAETWKITIRLRHKDGTTVLVPGTQVDRLRPISDFKYGAGSNYGENIGAVLYNLNSRVTTPIAASDSAFTSTQNIRVAKTGKMMRHDLGSIFLADGDEIAIDMNCTIDDKVSVVAFSEDRRPHEVLTYEVVQDVNNTFTKCQEIYAMTPNVDIFAADVTFKVSDSNDTVLSDVIGIFTSTALIGQYEAALQPGFGLLWSNTLPIPDTVQVQMTGLEAKDSLLVVIRKEYLRSAVSNNTITEAEKLVAKVEKLEREDPEQAKAMRHAGVIDKSENISASVDAVKASQKIDNAK